MGGFVFGALGRNRTYNYSLGRSSYFHLTTRASIDSSTFYALGRRMKCAILNHMSGTDLSNQEKLEEIYEMTLQNNTILRSLRKQQRIAIAFRLLYWVIILGALGGVYYYLRPVFTGISDNKTKIDQTIQQFNQLRSNLPESRIFDQIFHTNSSTTTP